MTRPAKTIRVPTTEDGRSIPYPLLDTLHPVPRNIPSPSYSRTTKEERREQEKQAWQLHTTLLRHLGIKPYDQCICDVVGLDEDFQVVKDPSSAFEYAHRPACLAYPNLKHYNLDPHHSTKHAAQRAAFTHFRKTARSMTGRKKFTKFSMEKLESHCGLHYHASTIDRFAKCLCDFIMYDKSERRSRDPADLEELKCIDCGYCCTSCSPTCHGLPPSQWDLAQLQSQTEPPERRPLYATSDRIRTRVKRSGLRNHYDPGTIVSDVLRAAACNPRLVISRLARHQSKTISLRSLNHALVKITAGSRDRIRIDRRRDSWIKLTMCLVFILVRCDLKIESQKQSYFPQHGS